MMTDIKERLRKAQIWLNDGKCCGQVDADGTCLSPACIFGEALKTFWEAAARIEELEAEVERLRTHDLHSECEQNCSWYQAQKEALANALDELALYRKKRPDR